MMRLHWVLVPVSKLCRYEVSTIGLMASGVSIALMVSSLQWNFDFWTISFYLVSVLDFTVTLMLGSSARVEFTDVYSRGNIEVKPFHKACLGLLRRLWRATMLGYMLVIDDGLLG